MVLIYDSISIYDIWFFQAAIKMRKAKGCCQVIFYATFRREQGMTLKLYNAKFHFEINIIYHIFLESLSL